MQVLAVSSKAHRYKAGPLCCYRDMRKLAGAPVEFKMRGVTNL